MRLLLLPMLLLTACGKDSEQAKMGEIVDEKSGYSCVYTGKSQTGGLFGSPVTTYNDYQCENLKTGVFCRASVSEDGKNKITFCDQFDWSMLEEK